MYSATALEVLIASPSDTTEQRLAIREAVIDWNSSNSRYLGVVLLPVMWESHSIPELSGRPQAILNDQIVDAADILIATFWTRIGGSTGEAISGTVEEISRFRADGRPTHIYFCDMPTTPLDTDTTQIEALKKYRDELKSQGLFSSYRSIPDLRFRVRDDLTKRVHDMQQKGLIGIPASTVPVRKSDEDSMVARESATIDPLVELHNALRGYHVRWEAEFQSFNDYSVDQRHDLMRQVAAVTLEVIGRVAAQAADAPILQELKEIAANARTWADYRVFLDGGVSFNALSEGCREVLNEAHRVVDQPWP